MKTVKVIVDGKEVLFPANNSSWISDKESPLPKGWTWEFLKAQPRVRVADNGAPTIKIGETEVKLGWKGFTDDEKKKYNEYKKDHSGTGSSGSSSKVPDYFLEELLSDEIFGKLSKKSQEFVESLKPKDKKLEQAKKLLGGMSAEQLELLKAMLGGNVA